MIRNEEDLFIYQKDQIIDKADNSLFIDEIQDIDGFEHVLRSLKSKESCDVFCTGSNARMLPSELPMFLSGRYIEFHIHSILSWVFHQLPDNTQSLILYLTYGGMFYLSRLALANGLAFEYLRNVYATVSLGIKKSGLLL